MSQDQEFIYVIKDWNDTYENAASRRITNTTYLLIPNSHDGSRYCKLTLHENFPEIFGIWIGILQVASKCKTRGVLESKHGPLTPEDISNICRIRDADKVSAAIDVLSSKEIGWIIKVPIDRISEYKHCDKANNQPEKQQQAGEDVCKQQQAATSIHEQLKMSLGAAKNVPRDNKKCALEQQELSYTEQNRTEGDRTEHKEQNRGAGFPNATGDYDTQKSSVLFDSKDSSSGQGWTPPEIWEVASEFRRQGGSEPMAEAFFGKYEAKGWITKEGTKLTYWKNFVPSFIDNYRRNHVPSGGPIGSHRTSPPRKKSRL